MVWVPPSAAFHKRTASRTLETCNYHFDWLIIIQSLMQPQSASPSTASAQIAHLSRPDQRSPLLQPCRLHSNASPSDLTSVCANKVTRLISQTCILASTCHRQVHNIRHSSPPQHAVYLPRRRHIVSQAPRSN